MKKIIVLLISSFILFSCTKDEPTMTGGCTYNGKYLIVGPKGGCYYMNSNGNKTYVDRYHCNCK